MATAVPTSRTGRHGTRAGAASVLAPVADGGTSARWSSSSGAATRSTTTATAATSPSPATSPQSREWASTAASEPRTPPTLQAPWNELSRLRPYRRSTATPCMFIVASTMPSRSPTSATTG